MEIKKEDLWKTCERCKGTGSYTEAIAGENQTQYGCPKITLTDSGKVMLEFIQALRTSGEILY